MRRRSRTSYFSLITQSKMKAFFVTLLSIFIALNYAESFDLDVSQTKFDEKFVAVHEYKDPDQGHKITAKLFVANNADLFSNVKDGSDTFWTGVLEHKAVFVRALLKDDKIVAMKMKTVQKLPKCTIKPIGHLFIKIRGYWTEIGKLEFDIFLKEQGLKNLAWVSYETDQRFKSGSSGVDVPLVGEGAGKFEEPEECEEPKDDPKKQLRGKEEVETPSPRAGSPEQAQEGPVPGKQIEELQPGSQDKGEGKTVEKKEKNEDTKAPDGESSFLTSTVLLPSALLLFYLTY